MEGAEKMTDIETIKDVERLKAEMNERPKHSDVSKSILDSQRVMIDHFDKEVSRATDRLVERQNQHFEAGDTRQKTFFDNVDSKLDTKVSAALDKMIKRQDSQRNMLIGGAVVLVLVQAVINWVGG